jgi:hypothetical protein
MFLRTASTTLLALAAATVLSIGVASAQGEGDRGGLYVGRTAVSSSACTQMDFHIMVHMVGGGQNGTLEGYAFASNMADMMSALHGKITNGVVTAELAPMHGNSLKGPLTGEIKDGKMNLSMNGVGCSQFRVTLPVVSDIPTYG